MWQIHLSCVFSAPEDRTSENIYHELSFIFWHFWRVQKLILPWSRQQWGDLMKIATWVSFYHTCCEESFVLDQSKSTLNTDDYRRGIHWSEHIQWRENGLWSDQVSGIHTVTAKRNVFLLLHIHSSAPLVKMSVRKKLCKCTNWTSLFDFPRNAAYQQKL